MKIVSFVKITFILIIIFLSSCESIKRGVSGEKKKAGDEFLIEKKNPLVLPPNFDDLPKPQEKTENDSSKSKNIDFSSVLEKSSNEKKIIKKDNNSLERSISKILNSK